MIRISRGISLVVQWLRLCLPMQGMRVQSLVGELRSHKPQGHKPKHKIEAILLTNSIKTLKMVHVKKKKKLKKKE